MTLSVRYIDGDIDLSGMSDPVTIQSHVETVMNEKGKTLMQVADEDSFNAWMHISQESDDSEVWKHTHIFLRDDDTNAMVQYYFNVTWLPKNGMVRLHPKNPEIVQALDRLKAEVAARTP